jgi:hypothetical protein
MTTIELHPEFLTKDGEREFAVLSYKEYMLLEEWLRDMADLLEIREERSVIPDEPNITLETMEKEMGLK